MFKKFLAGLIYPTPTNPVANTEVYWNDPKKYLEDRGITPVIIEARYLPVHLPGERNQTVGLKKKREKVEAP